MMKARLRMFYFGLAHAPDGPWQAHCRILNQDRTGTCPRTAAAAPRRSPAQHVRNDSIGQGHEARSGPGSRRHENILDAQRRRSCACACLPLAWPGSSCRPSLRGSRPSPTAADHHQRAGKSKPRQQPNFPHETKQTRSTGAVGITSASSSSLS